MSDSLADSSKEQGSLPEEGMLPETSPCSSGALISPDSQNNNRPNPEQPCVVSPEKDPRVETDPKIIPTETDDSLDDSDRLVIDDPSTETTESDRQNFDGKILYKDGAALIIENGADKLLPADWSTEKCDQSQQPVVSAVHLRKKSSDLTCEPVVQRYKVFGSVTELNNSREVVQSTSHSSQAAGRILICFICKLSFSGSAGFEAHAATDHRIELSGEERALLISGGASVILQTGPQVSFLMPVVDDEEQKSAEELEEAPQTPKSEISAEEIARNLMLASELSASRLLHQVSQNALATMAYPQEALQGCVLHPEGKSPSVECAKCDLILGTKPLQPPSQFAHCATAAARNSCKTLKCPKCNWHYKYQETLEIHMKEKHPDSEVTCGYCLHNQPHPKLARGETYGCGYKPYRCEICKYSTTTKGNLSIHMQSDKHLNNVQELQQGGSLIDPNSLIHAPQAPGPTRLSPPVSEPASNTNSRPSSSTPTTEKLRCDVCNYETTVGRNLRIHMTSEKHNQNTLLLQRKLALCAGTSWGDLGQNFGYTLTGLDTASLLGLQRGDGEFVGNSLQDLSGALYQCCVCVRYGSDSLDEMAAHIQADRSVPGPQDVSVLAGNYFCNLCQYKTHLKANFQLHTKTDKHIQRLMLVNHVREGGPENEWRLRYVNVNNPVQLRCNACNEFFTSSHKLQVHTLSARHSGFVKAFSKIQADLHNSESQYICNLCDCSGKRTEILQHLHSTRHREALNLSQDSDEQDWIQVLQRTESTENRISPDGDESGEEDWNFDDEQAESMTDAIHCCAWCNYTCKTSTDLRDHVKAQHGDGDDPVNQTSSQDLETGRGKSLSCPLCQIDCGQKREQVEQHLSHVHNVTEKGIRRLMPLVPAQEPSHPSTPSLSPPASVPADSTTAADSDLEADYANSDCSAFPCSVCSVPFSSCEELYEHQSESGHLELKQTPNGPGYLCWQKGCNQYFKTAAAVQVHFREIHAKKTPIAGCISDRHVYKYRCSQCSLAFRTEQKLQEHSIYHLMRASTKCAICSRNFRKIDALRRHVQTTHINENGGEPEPLGTEMGPDLTEEHSIHQEVTEDRRSVNGGLTEDDKLNSQAQAEAGYGDPSRRYQCHKCKVGFTKQIYLAGHQKTLSHRRGDKVSYSVEKFLDPNRPFKCEICKESFTQKPILFVHFNSVSHLHKMKKLMEQQNPDLNLSPQELANLNRGHQNLLMMTSSGNSSAASANKTAVSHQQTKVELAGKRVGNLNLNTTANNNTSAVTKQFKCNICKVAYNQGSQLDIHLRSVAHQSRVSKLVELAASGEVDMNLPAVEQPDGEKAGSKQLISEMIAKKQQPTSSKHQQQQLESAAMLVNMMSAQLPAFLMQAFQQQQQMFNMHTCPTCNSIFSSEGDLKSHQAMVCGGGGHKLTGSAARKGTPVKRDVASTPDTSVMNGFENPDSPSPDDSAVGRGLVKPTLGGKHGGTFRKLLGDYGFEVVMQYNEMFQQRKRKHLEQAKKEEENDENELPEKKMKMEVDSVKEEPVENQPELPEMQKSTCTECGKTFSSIWVLKAHFEQVHQAQTVSDEALEEVSEQIKSAYEQKIKNSPQESPDKSTTSEESTVASAVSSVIAQVTKPVVSRQSTPPPAPSAPASKQTPSTPVSQPQTSLAGQMPMPAGAFMPGFPFLPGAGFSPFAGAFANPFMPFMMPPGMGAGSSGADAAGNLPDFLKAAAALAPATSVAAAAPATSAAMQSHAALAAAAQQAQAGGKRARTRITDEQLSVLRDYFDINNSPTEQQIEEMSVKSGLPQKVIKHWFRNTLFKERQRNKDSPYNFSIPPSLGIDLEEYEKTGEAKIIPYKDQESTELTPQKKEETKIEMEKDDEMEKKLVIAEKEPPEIKKEPISVKEEKMELTETPKKATEHQDLPPMPSDLVNALKLSPQQLLSAQETLRQLTAGQMSGFPAAANPFSLLAVTQQQLAEQFSEQEKTGFSAQATSQSPSPIASSSSDTMTSLIASAMTPGGALSGPGRRANRTRFSDFQLKELQDFFEKQAYPKDDDLEYLSKKLQLSPRVIVVWFQNARQKARKVYENQPHTEADRFVKTPGCNFQCKRCNLVFQRYYELIQHQQKQCYKDDAEMIGEHVSRTSESSSKSPRNSDVSSTKSDSGNEFYCDKCNIFFNGAVQLEEHLKVHANNPLLFAEEPQVGSCASTNTKRKIAQMMEEVGRTAERKRSRSNPKIEAVICVEKTRSRSKDRRKTPPSFNKRCPFCGILFHTKISMENHLQSRHMDQCQKTIVNIDLLPHAEEVCAVPTITTTTADLLLNGNSLAHSMLSFGMLPGSPGGSASGSNPVDLMKKLAEGVGGPLDLTRPVTVKTDDDRSRSGSQSVSPNISYCQSDNEDNQSNISQDLDSPSPALGAGGQLGAGGGFPRPPSKRFRTHLTAMQVNVMKHQFNDYKTPSMAECELLGGIIGLHKRVVQVWFQNARAKERKHKAAAGESPRAHDLVKISGSTKCSLCGVQYSQKHSLQDHIFSREHIEKIKEYLRLHGTEDMPSGGAITNRSSPGSSRNQSPRGVSRLSTSAGVSVSVSASAAAPTSTTASAAQTAPRVSASEGGTGATANAAAMAAAAAAAQNLLASNPYMNPAAYYNNLASTMMYSAAGLSGLPMAMYDPTIYGTPVNMLQIPPGVMQLISNKMRDTAIPSVSFTQDGMKIEDLIKTVSNPKDLRSAAKTDLEVGWACRKCATVFQSEAQFLSHQRMICQSSEPAFKLIQSHYECRACNTKFGTQAEFKKHCATESHIMKSSNV